MCWEHKTDILFMPWTPGRGKFDDRTVYTNPSMPFDIRSFLVRRLPCHRRRRCRTTASTVTVCSLYRSVPGINQAGRLYTPLPAFANEKRHQRNTTCSRRNKNVLSTSLCRCQHPDQDFLAYGVNIIRRHFYEDVKRTPLSSHHTTGVCSALANRSLLTS